MLIHREKAHKKYLKNKEEYPLPYSYYQVIHKNKNKEDNKLKNLLILLPIENNYKNNSYYEKEFDMIINHLGI